MNASPILCYVTDRTAVAEGDLRVAIRHAIAAGVDWIQIREKDLPARELGALVREGVAAARGTSTRIIVNDRLDIAVTENAAGVHLGGESMPVADVRAWCSRFPALPAGFLIGASTHSLDAAQAAERDDADYIFFGPVFATPAKLQYGPPQGLARLEEVCRAVRIPVIAIGGITTENTADCLRVGAAGIAAIRLFQESPNVDAVVRALRPARL
jgi:thiamine-phosphate pyrophosphorylase